MAEPPEEIDTEQLAEQVVEELDPGSVVNDKVVLSRRQLLALTGGGAGLAALGFGPDVAAAADGTNDTSVGDVGAAGDSVDVYVDELRDDSGDEWLDVDDTGDVNAAFRPWDFGTIRPSTVDAGSVNTNELANDTGLSISRTKLSAQNPIIEDWGRGTVSYYGGQTGRVSVVQSPTLPSNANAVQVTNGSAKIRTPFEVRRTQRIRQYIQFNEKSSQTFGVILVSTDQGTLSASGDGYVFELDASGPAITIQRRDGGSPTDLATSTSLAPPTGERLIMEVDLNPENITFAIINQDGTELDSVSANDTTYPNGSPLFYQFQIRNESSNSATMTHLGTTRRSL